MPAALEGSLADPAAMEAAPELHPAACASAPPTPPEAQAARRCEGVSASVSWCVAEPVSSLGLLIMYSVCCQQVQPPARVT
jgi:hypothetical protein